MCSDTLKRNYQPIKTPLGFIYGRDGIYLEEVVFKNRTNQIELLVSLNSELSEEQTEDKIDFSDCILVFKGVLASKIYELDSWDWESKSSFDEIVDSTWIKELGGKVTAKNKHYFLQTYDDIIEIVCDSYEFKPVRTNT